MANSSETKSGRGGTALGQCGPKSVVAKKNNQVECASSNYCGECVVLQGTWWALSKAEQTFGGDWEDLESDEEVPCDLSCLGDPFDPDCNPGGTPIIVDLGPRGIRLTGYERGVLFDLDDDGVAERLGWAQRGWGDAFLAMDRDGSGRIENGAELFGDRTVLLNGGRAAHGFEALAELDELGNGGNGNGMIDPGDVSYDDLLLWGDANHDGFADATELASLREHGVQSLELAFHESRRRDSHGNQFRYNASAEINTERGLTRRVLVSDVILVREPRSSTVTERMEQGAACRVSGGDE